MLLHIRCENGLTYTMRTFGCIRIPDANVRMSDLARFDIHNMKVKTCFSQQQLGHFQPNFVCKLETKIHLLDAGHMTKLADMPIYSINT